MTRVWILGCVAFGIGACTVAPPPGPSVLALPPAGKDFAQFQREDVFCQQTAMSGLGLNSEGAPAQAALGSAAVGTVLGAAAGGLIGAATGNFGAGAAIGAGAGLALGGAAGAGAAQNTHLNMQDRYDITYAQCMASYGNSVQPLRVGVPVPVYVQPHPYFGPRVGFGFGGYSRRW